MSVHRVSKIKISIPFLALTAILYVLDMQNVFLPTFLAVLFHEFGHIAAIKLCGGTIEKIDIKLFGARIYVPELALMPYKSEIIIAAAGPGAGFLTAVSCLAAAKFLKFEIPDYFVGINVVISVINLIPVYPLDGGRIVFGASMMLFSLKSAYIIYYIISLFAAFFVCLLCGIGLSQGVTNPTIFIFALYVLVCAATIRPRL